MWINSSIDEILENLYLGNAEASRDSKCIKKYNIEMIISIMENPKIFHDSIEYKLLNVKDNTEVNIAQHFEKVCYWIHKKRLEKKSVLVHCQAGISRSATLVISYLMVIFEINERNALEFLLSKRSIVEPNFGFMCQLNEFGNNISQQLSKNLLGTHPTSNPLILCDREEYKLFNQNRKITTVHSYKSKNNQNYHPTKCNYKKHKDVQNSSILKENQVKNQPESNILFSDHLFSNPTKNERNGIINRSYSTRIRKLKPMNLELKHSPKEQDSD